MRLLLCLLALTSALPATAQDDVPGFALHVRAGDRSLPLALPQTRSIAADDAADTVWRTVRRDLEMSGYFDVIDPDAFFEAPDAGIEPGSFSFRTWQMIRAAALAKTRVRATGSGLEAVVYLYDVGVGNKLMGKRLTAPANGARKLGHRIADEILRALGAAPLFEDAELVAVRTTPRGKEIVLVGLDGAGVRQVTDNRVIDLSPAFSPDGASIAWTSYRSDRPEVFVKHLARGTVRLLSGAPGLNTGATFSPDGTTVALSRQASDHADIVLLDAATGREIRRLTQGGGIDVSPSFSPDGARIAFSSERSGGSQIFVVPTAGGTPERVTFQGTWNTEPRFSPDGSRIAFVGRDDHHDIFVIDADGRNLRRITQGQGNNESPAWSPDGRYLVFTSTRTGRSEIWLSTADGRHQVQITDGGGWSQPSWRPR